MIYYTADLHLGHKNILAMSNRNFNNIEDHDAAIITNWNNTVKDMDEIYIVGDLAYRNKIDSGVYLNKLKGKKHLILGNHDLNFKDINYANRKYFEGIEQMAMINDGEHQAVLCHYPILEWSGYFRGTYHIYGHIHNNKTNKAFEYLRSEDRALNGGVDINNFKPCRLSELITNNNIFKTSI